jgi:ABC-2 type transport system permease protein
VNLAHFRTFLWLRWRLFVNQLSRGGIANAVVLAILAVVVAAAALGALAGSFLLGRFALDTASPLVLLFVWDGAVVGCLFFWMTGVLAELQRSEAISLDKLLHLPVSLRSAFLINYLSLFISPSLIIFMLAMLGLSVGLVLARGPALLVQFPLVAAFLLALTALTYQFQGWLASLMINKRRRRTIIALLTAGFILLAQLPNLINVVRPWSGGGNDRNDRLFRDTEELTRQMNQKKITVEEFQKQHDKLLRDFNKRDGEQFKQAFRTAGEVGWVVNAVLPPGWLPLGTMEAAQGNFLPALLGTLGLTAIGGASLWRSYRTTMRIYTGHYNRGSRQALAPPAPLPAPGTRAAPLLLERRLPWFSEYAQAVALAGFRGMLRAPEVKTLLLGPLLIFAVIGSSMLTKAQDMPLGARPLLAFGAGLMVLFSLAQLVANQFAFDRSGFRVFVLSAAPRREILIGKNLAFVPFATAILVLFIAVLQVLAPLRWDHLLAVLPRLVSMFLLFCMGANLISLLAPLPMAAGSLRPASARVLPSLLQAALFLLMPLLLAPVLLPLGLEVLLDYAGWLPGAPVDLAGSLLLCAGVVVIYRVVLSWQGELLQSREQTILDIVSARSQ